MGPDVRRVGVVLVNLGGPDRQEAVRPFLFNLFHDPAIISLPQPFRWLIAQLISRLREKSAQANYAKMGGGSPIVPESLKQADALRDELNRRWLGNGAEAHVTLAMRYWKPYSTDAVAAMRAAGVDQVVFTPLYPQFSTTTTASSWKAWQAAGWTGSRAICCYPSLDGFITAHVDRVVETWEKAGRPARTRVLFSAHGLPQKVIDEGDPYQSQVEETVAAIAARLPEGLEHVICYQSRVGPLKWIGPSTEEALETAAHDKMGVIVSPVAFVSEHIETLVELDEEYAEKAEELGLPHYLRAPAIGTHPAYISALADLVDEAAFGSSPIVSARANGDCGGGCPVCPRRQLTA
jgi:ferrochelatase